MFYFTVLVLYEAMACFTVYAVYVTSILALISIYIYIYFMVETLGGLLIMLTWHCHLSQKKKIY
jgi:hypothetical protein